MALSLKNEGNELFKAGHLLDASAKYGEAITLLEKDKDVSQNILLSTCLSNRAACYLNLSKESGNGSAKDLEILGKRIVSDCTQSFEKNASNKKALFRRAQGYLLLKNKESDAMKDLSLLVHLDAKNKDAINLLREVSAKISKKHVGVSEVTKILCGIRELEDNTKESSLKVDLPLPPQKEQYLRSLIALCLDDASHQATFVRENGLADIQMLVNSHWEDENMSVLKECFTLLGALCNYHDFVSKYVVANESLSSKNEEIKEFSESCFTITQNDISYCMVSFSQLCKLALHIKNTEILKIIISLLLRILKALPLYREQTEIEKNLEYKKVEAGDVRVEELSKEKEKQEKKVMYVPYLCHEDADLFLQVLCKAISSSLEDETKVFALDSLAAFQSECGDYVSPEMEVDTRLESLEERKTRIRRRAIIKKRASNHAFWSLPILLDILVEIIDGDSKHLKARCLPCFGRIMLHASDEFNEVPRSKNKDESPEDTSVKEDLVLKNFLQPYLVSKNDANQTEKRKRASLTAALLTCTSDLGMWALQRNNGIQQILTLIASMDTSCQDIAAEVLCLTSSVEGGNSLLAAALENGAIHALLKAENPNTRAAAAATITKLSIKAKALEEDSPEVSQVLNAAFDVIKIFGSLSSGKEIQDIPKNNLVSFSKVGDSTQEKLENDKSISLGIVDNQSNSMDRAIEVIAAIVGKTHVKEEIVHGSYRVSQQAFQNLMQLEVSPKSQAAYGIAHIMALLTVTNKELHEIALAEKEMTLDEYERLQELQRIKTKDDEGNPLEEKKETPDTDTELACKIRIQKIVNKGGIMCLVKLLANGSMKTKELSARSLRQICVEESARGIFIQQGGLKACFGICSSYAPSSEKVSKNSSESAEDNTNMVTKREAAHAIAKTLVTTDPNLLQAHMRLGSIEPLIALCGDVDATQLQQFEALLALTNLLSVSDSEASKFLKVKGHFKVHYLMFSDNMMVRRAACEVFCNVPTREEVLKLMRQPEKVRLWLGLCEDWDNKESESVENPEALSISRACSGTLASACSDVEVCKAVLKEEIGGTIVKLLQSKQVELIHRCIVMLNEILETHGTTEMCMHMLESGVIAALTEALKLIQTIGSKFPPGESLIEMSKGCLEILLKAMKAHEDQKALDPADTTNRVEEL